jgi:heat shock protein HslJ
MPILVGPVWEWVSSSLKGGTILAPGDPGRYTFQLLGEGNALIQADCNFGTGSYAETADTFAFTAIGTTKMACPPDSMDSAFLAQLRYIASYRFEGGDLSITLKDDAGTVRLRGAPEAAAAGAAVTEVAPGSAVTRTQSTSPAPQSTHTTRPATALPTSTAAPPASPTPARTATQMPMLFGTPVPVSSPAADATVLPALSGTNWLLVSLTANGQAVPPVGSTPITLDIDPQGRRISGSTGCNEYRVTLRADSQGAAVLGPALTTQKACSADLMVQEVGFIDGLLRSRSYVLRGNELTLVDVAGNSLMVLVRK